MEKVRRVMSTLLVILLSTLAVAFAAPPLLGMRVLIVLGTSMEPTLNAGDLAYLEKISPEEIEVGDIIAFTLPGGATATHRVVKIARDERSFVTMGDANQSIDSPVPFDRLMGRVLFAIPFAGRIVAAMKGLAGIVTLAGWILLMFLLNRPVRKKCPEKTARSK